MVFTRQGTAGRGPEGHEGFGLPTRLRRFPSRHLNTLKGGARARPRRTQVYGSLPAAREEIRNAGAAMQGYEPCEVTGCARSRACIQHVKIAWVKNNSVAKPSIVCIMQLTVSPGPHTST